MADLVAVSILRFSFVLVRCVHHYFLVDQRICLHRNGALKSYYVSK